MDADGPPKTIAQRLFLRLREDILHCRLRPGDRLRLDTLRVTYEVGMSPLREALSRLVSVGLVTAEGQRGFSVARISVEDLLDLTKTRAWVEVVALRFAMATGDRDWEANILASEHRLSGCPVYIIVGESRMANEVWQARHRAFHAALVSVAASPHILRFREHLYDLSERYRRLSGLLPKTERNIVHEHQALAQAVLARDTTLASERMIEHLVATTRRILESDAEHQHVAVEHIARLMENVRAGMTGEAARAFVGA